MIKVNNNVVKLDKFPDGTYNIKGDPTLVDDVVVISWHYHDDAEFMAVAFLTKYYQAHGNEVVLYLPYVPNARMDRIENADDIFTMKYFGEMINSLNFSKVFVMDVHSSVAIAVIKNCQIIRNEMANAVINKIVEIEDEVPLVFFPDEGAMKRYSKNLIIRYAFGMKNRDWFTGKITGYEVIGINADDINGKNILIWDDICSKGGTFYHAAKKLKEMGANNIYLMVTHCENNIHKGEFGDENVNLLATGLIKRVFTTDSIYTLGSSEIVTVGNLCLEYNRPEDNMIAIPVTIAENCECNCCQQCCNNSDNENYDNNTVADNNDMKNNMEGK
ncbi:MAG: hypothetical protein IKW51_08550 [Bacteroidales bacterium]|nr:hypothetical protein [Bacteroidales bacterium]